MENNTLSPVEFLEEFQSMLSDFCSCQSAINGETMSVLSGLMKFRMVEKVSTYTGEDPEILMFDLVRLISTIGQGCNLLVVKGKSIQKAEKSIVLFTLQEFESWFYEMMVGAILTAA